MLTGIGTFFQIIVYFSPGNNLAHIRFLCVELSHAGNIEGIGLLLQRVDINNLLLQLR